jgi:protein-S-isoprenylcysteine O-methyltransferase Ste14
MTSQAQTTTRGARVIFIPPPLYYVAAFVGGMLLNTAVPLPVGGRPATTVVGAVVAVLGLVLNFAGVAAVIRHRTTIVPHRPVATLITTGAYQWSRNPMYTGLAMAALGGGLLAGSWWPILLMVPALLVMALLVIAPEERYLAERFGPSYADYRARVRRWL